MAIEPEIPIIRPTLFEREACYAEFDQILDSGRLTTGPFTERFEDAILRRVGVKHAICVNSCTSGLMLLQRALGLAGEVIIPTFTWTATGTSLLWNNCTPVFVDCEDSVYTVDPNAIEAAITPATQAICPVAVFGVPSDRARIEAIGKKHGIPVYYDSAQALGATFAGRPAGGFGAAEVFSLSPTKVVSAAEMGVVTTNDDTLARRIRQMRDYGKSNGDEDIVTLGLSVRPSEFHAVIGYHALGHIDELMAHRGEMIALYRERLTGIPGIRFQETPPDRTGSNNYFVILVGKECGTTRDALCETLREQSIGCKRYFYPCLHQQTVFRQTRFRVAPRPRPGTGSGGSLDISERAASEALALPLFGHITADQVNRVADLVLTACG